MRRPGWSRLAFAVAASAVLVTATGVGAVAQTDTAVSLPQAVSSSPVSWTPNVFAGSSSCNAQWFGPKPNTCVSTVYSEAIVNGEVVVAGAFTQACQPGPSSSGHCVPGTLVTRDDIFAYTPGTGAIDPNFAPTLDAGPVFSVIAGPPGSNTVYIGGQFTTINGVSQRGLAQLQVTPGAPATDGQLVSTFKGHVSNYVSELALNGNALYVGGQFSTADSSTATGLVRLDATTGAVDPSFKMTLSNPENGAALRIEAMALSPDGTQLAFGGTALTVNGQPRPRLALAETGGGLNATASLANFSAPVLSNNCSAEHDYVRAIDFSPDSSYFVIGTTGYLSSPLGAPNVCDATARFSLSAGATGTGSTDNVSPAWIDFTGGDSIYSLAISGGVVYAGGHNRWVGNECGADFLCEPGAVLVNGVAALDSGTGLPLPWWQPQTSRAHGIMFLATYGAGAFPGSNGGLLLGGAATSVGSLYHGENALFPLTSTSTPVTGGPIPSGLFNSDGGTSQATPMCLAENSSPSPAQAVLGTCMFNPGTLYDPGQNWTVPAGGAAGPIGINGLCLDAASGGTTSGAPVIVDACGGAPSQQWQQGSGNTLVNTAAGLCLTDPGSSTHPGVQLQVATCVTAAQNQIWPLPAAQAPPALPATGPVFSRLTASDTSDVCLNDAGGHTSAGNPVELYPCNGGSSENWTVEPNGAIEYKGNCLDSAGGGTSITTKVVIDPCTGAPSQSWHWSGPGNYQLVQQASGLCLDDPGSNTSKNEQLQIYSCNGGNNQSWRLPAV